MPTGRFELSVSTGPGTSGPVPTIDAITLELSTVPVRRNACHQAGRADRYWQQRPLER